MNTPTPNPVLRAIADHFTENDLKFEVKSEDCLIVPISTETIECRILVDTDEDGGPLLVSGVFPFRVPAARRNDFAVKVAEINFGRRVGDLQFNAKDGLVVYKTSTFLAANPEEHLHVVKVLLGHTIGAMEELIPRLVLAAYASERQSLTAADILEHGFGSRRDGLN